MSKPGVAPAADAKARGAAQDFEAVFLNSMFTQMFSGVGEGPFSGGQAAKTWQSFLTDEYAKNFAKAGGVGIADIGLPRTDRAAGGASEMTAVQKTPAPPPVTTLAEGETSFAICSPRWTRWSRPSSRKPRWCAPAS